MLFNQLVQIICKMWLTIKQGYYGYIYECQ